MFTGEFDLPGDYANGALGGIELILVPLAGVCGAVAVMHLFSLLFLNLQQGNVGMVLNPLMWAIGLLTAFYGQVSCTLCKKQIRIEYIPRDLSPFKCPNCNGTVDLSEKAETLL
jgi:predicted RNA-binding Zn-ribbon protein involved in translation (DUF1610 family)